MVRVRARIDSPSFARTFAPSAASTLCLLGEAALRAGNRHVALRLRPKAVALIAYLALEHREISRHDIARLVFPASEEPLASLRWHLAHVRSQAPARVSRSLRATRDRLALSIPTDVAAFRRSARLICQRPETPGAARALRLYRGDLLAGVKISATAEFDNWLYVLQESLRRDFRRASLAFARWALGHRASRQAVEPLARLVTVDPYCEDGHVQLIEAYEALGERTRAAAVYDRYQRIVRHELAAEPRPGLARRFEGRRAVGPTLPREDFVPLRDVTLHVVDWAGGDPTLVVIHGSAGMAHNFEALARVLTPRFRVIGVDLRGHGFSDKPPTGYDLPRHVEDLVQLITALGLRRPVLLGHSAGGTIAAFVASRADLAGMILLEGMIGDRAFTENAVAQSAPLATGLDLPVAGFDAYLVRWRARRAPYSDDAERLVDRWARFALAPVSGAYRERALRVAVEAEWASIIAADSIGALARTECPIMIVQALKPWFGGRPYFTSRIVRAQLRAAPHAELFVAADSDHASLIRDPEPAMIEAFVRFLAKCAATGVTGSRRQRRPA
jgi:pimeloyl-ACP methyl ester carboxylesterase/DNA-binding SARP family transcriptional activator